jgi:uncharacterized lipoprotein YddW (UPF0748 family)
MQLKNLLVSAAFVAGSILAGRPASYEPSTIIPPKAAREFRGVWIATVNNIDWPSKPGMSTAAQKAELIALLDQAAKLRLNAVVFQARPAGDAMYASKIEPWSEYLTGTMGKAPEPYYDPLAFAVEEAHRRGLELHAWINPYRALDFLSKSPIAASHVSKTHAPWVKKYGKYLWIDPGEKGAQDYLLKVILDVVKRYEIDAVQFDDYFYPERGDAGADSDFPDEASWRKYGAGGHAGRDDWRRENVNTFIQRVYQSIKEVKPWVKFGISPFGIWRPGFPPQARGKDAYATRWADSRKWLASGWVDYFAPQLYWPIEPKEQSFPALLNWWAEQNPKGRQLWPGIAAYKAERWGQDEIPNQIRLARKQAGVSGYILYNMRSLTMNAGLAEVLQHNINAEPALVPALPQTNTSRPGKPGVFIGSSKDTGLVMERRPAKSSQAWLWLIQTRSDGIWKTEIVPGTVTVNHLRPPYPEVIATTVVDRFGNEGEPVVLERRP